MNEWFKSLISFKPHGLNRCKYQSASRNLCWAPQRECLSCKVKANLGQQGPVFSAAAHFVPVLNLISFSILKICGC